MHHTYFQEKVFQFTITLCLLYFDIKYLSIFKHVIQWDLWEKTVGSHDSKQTQCYNMGTVKVFLPCQCKSLTTFDVSRFKTFLLMLSILYRSVCHYVILILCSFLASY